MQGYLERGCKFDAVAGPRRRPDRGGSRSRPTPGRPSESRLDCCGTTGRHPTARSALDKNTPEFESSHGKRTNHPPTHPRLLSRPAPPVQWHSATAMGTTHSVPPPTCHSRHGRRKQERERGPKARERTQNGELFGGQLRGPACPSLRHRGRGREAFFLPLPRLPASVEGPHASRSGTEDGRRRR